MEGGGLFSPLPSLSAEVVLFPVPPGLAVEPFVCSCRAGGFPPPHQRIDHMSCVYRCWSLAVFFARFCPEATLCLAFFHWLSSRGPLEPWVVWTEWAWVGSSLAARAVVRVSDIVAEVMPVMCLFVDTGMAVAAGWCRVVGSILFVQVGLGSLGDRPGLPV